jgi:hypothetical protein
LRGWKQRDGSARSSRGIELALDEVTWRRTDGRQDNGASGSAQSQAT